MDLQTTGMEFASEMVVKASLLKMRITEVPTTLSPDGRSRPPHLRPWRDGWRHLKFLLMHSPRWLYLYPGLAMAGGGLGAMTILALSGSVVIAGVQLQVHSMLAAGVLGLLGVQTLTFAVLARQFAVREGFLPATRNLVRLRHWATLERVVAAGIFLLLAGLVGLGLAAVHWALTGFGPLDYAQTMRAVVPSLVAMGIGLQLVLSGFLSGILDLPRIKERK